MPVFNVTAVHLNGNHSIPNVTSEILLTTWLLRGELWESYTYTSTSFTVQVVDVIVQTENLFDGMTGVFNLSDKLRFDDFTKFFGGNDDEIIFTSQNNFSSRVGRGFNESVIFGEIERDKYDLTEISVIVNKLQITPKTFDGINGTSESFEVNFDFYGLELDASAPSDPINTTSHSNLKTTNRSTKAASTSYSANSITWIITVLTYLLLSVYYRQRQRIDRSSSSVT